jgi:tRNA pseudouridine32 synthase/23S rRNA pseudouridine746 synthase
MTASPQPAAGDLVILFEDPHLLVVDKPAGLLSVPGRLPEHQDSIQTRAARHYPQALVVHRLDCATSGVMLLAKTKAAQSELSRQFRERETAKEYIAITYGDCPADQGDIDLPLIADWPNRPKQKICFEHGKPSLTRYELLARYGQRNRLRLIPVTGRSHQLRLHTQALGMPILGDTFYAPPHIQAMSPRLLLHATSLEFRHPATDHGIRIQSALPF